MTESASGGAFPELFEVIKDYAGRDRAHQVKALRVVAASYLPMFEVPPLPDARNVVEGILEGNGYLLASPETGGIEPAMVDAVVSVATSRLAEEDIEWGARCLMKVMDALRSRAQTEGYETYALDAEEVIDGLQTILAADIAEDVIEEALEAGDT